jgi:putative sigma-54 modulation protein
VGQEAIMTITTNARGFTLEQDEQELITKKLERLKYAEDLIVDLNLRIKEDKKFLFEATINFRWGGVAHVEEEHYEFAPGLNLLVDKLDVKIHKEKEKMEDTRKSGT